MVWNSATPLLVLALAVGAARAAETPPPDGDDPVVGTLFLRGEDGVSRPAVALETGVEIRVSGLVARAVVRQRFGNESDLWLHGVYVFPLPEMAAVDRMLLEVGERRIEGVIRERAQAKRSFEKAKGAGKTASLLEQERPNLFTTSVANIGPHEPVEITLEYQQTLRYDEGVFELRFPMALTARYIPGPVATGSSRARLGKPDGTGWSRPTDAVPDAARITPPLLHPDSAIVNPLSLVVALDAGFPLAGIESPSHQVGIATLGPQRYEVGLADVPADRDFVLRWRPERGHAPRAAVFSEERDGEHYALLMLLPPDEELAQDRIPREAIFVIDTSGSMGGASIEQARAALRLALDQLRPDDRFNVIAFDDAPRALFATPELADGASLRRARRFVDELRASGGTEMRSALAAALRDGHRSAQALRQVVVITDASIGNEGELFDAIERDLGDSRLFMVGIGAAPNAYFLNRAARLGRGTATLIGSPGEVRDRMQALFAKIERPVLRDLELHWNDEVEMWPKRVPDLYAGEPVLVTARLRRFVGDVVLRGLRGDRPFELRLPLGPGAHETGIHKLFARHQIAHWMMLPAAEADAARVRDEVLRVALAHQLVSKYTSLVAVDTTPRRPRSAAGAGTNVPGHGPAGFDPTLVAGVLPQTATPAPLLLGVGSALLALSIGLHRAGGRTT